MGQLCRKPNGVRLMVSDVRGPGSTNVIRKRNCMLTHSQKKDEFWRKIVFITKCQSLIRSQRKVELANR